MSDSPLAGSDGVLKLALWKASPPLMVADLFGITTDHPDPMMRLEPWAEAALNAFPSQQPDALRIALQGPTGNGKSAIMAWCLWNFLLCYGDQRDHPQAKAVSITAANLHAHFWKECAKWRHYRPPGFGGRDTLLERVFEQTSERIFCRDHPETWRCDAAAFPKDADEQTLTRTLAGLHSKYVASFIDESGAIPVAVMNGAEQAQSGRPAFFKVMQCGNPLTMDGMLHAAATKFREQWMVVRVTGDPDDPARSARVPLAWAREQVALRGRSDPWVKVYILAEFPDKPFNALLSSDDVDRAMKRAPRPPDFDFAPRVLGLDVARGGLAQSALASRQGCMVWPIQTWPSTVMGPEGAGHVAARWRDWQADALFNDGTGGFAGSWHDSLVLLGHAPIAVHFAGEPTDRRYANKRAEMWWRMAEDIKARVALPQDPRLAAQLTAMTFSFRGDRILMEDKEQVERRCGITLDEADSLALTYAQDVAPRRGPLARGSELMAAIGLDRPQVAVTDAPW